VANAAPYQDLLKAVMLILALVALITGIEAILGAAKITEGYAMALAIIVAVLGATVMGIGIRIMTMAGGDFMIGTIVSAVGAFIAGTAAVAAITGTPGEDGVAADPVFASMVVPDLIASSLGMLIAGAKSGASLM
jgi:hypothetical protein